jgi:uncharacterized tellurite resistance protein B-like protein
MAVPKGKWDGGLDLADSRGGRLSSGAAAVIVGRQCIGDQALTMFGPLKTFILRLFEDAKCHKQLANTDCRLATAALLVRVASVNGEMSEPRREKLHAVLKRNFGLDYLTTIQLIDGAAAAERSAVDLYHFTRHLNQVLDDEGRRRIVGMMWEIIYVDGSVNDFEANIIWRASDLLGVSSRERIELRQRTVASKVGLFAVGLADAAALPPWRALRAGGRGPLA